MILRRRNGLRKRMVKEFEGHDSWILTGRVISGTKRAAFFTQLDWVQEQCMEKLGFRPFPGTLNLEMDEESLPALEAIQKEKGIDLIPSDPKFCAAMTMPVSIGAVTGALIIPAEDVRVHGKNIVEVMAPAKLMDELNLDFGDPVTLIVSRTGPILA